MLAEFDTMENTLANWVILNTLPLSNKEGRTIKKKISKVETLNFVFNQEPVLHRRQSGL